ncbi:hypothetical protein [Porphyromonas gingivalis]|uniref:hypothetical protein n=1 Tax=Porphyromonas gingivalis TaxID=837 RepID=UPI001F300299|nr:hypothetical protein [Porphyromonas gingivalis]
MDGKDSKNVSRRFSSEKKSLTKKRTEKAEIAVPFFGKTRATFFLFWREFFSFSRQNEKLPEPCFFRLSILYFLEPEASLDITLQRQKGETKKTSNPTSTKK